jgi:hypothetical protein
LAEESQQAVLGVPSRADVVQAAGRGVGQSQGVVEFPIDEEPGVTGNGRAVELQFDLTVEVNAQGVILAVTHWVPLSFRQEVVGNAGFSREKAQTPCRNDRTIWEIRVNSSVALFRSTSTGSPNRTLIEMSLERRATFCPFRLGHNAPETRAVESPERGRVVAEPMMGNLVG